MHGTLAGFVATLPMSAFMWGARELLPQSEQYSLPPHQLVAKLAKSVGIAEAASGPDHNLVTIAAHFGYGATAGALYTALPSQILPSPILRGTIFGLLVWAGSYLGLLPALGILSPATQHPVGRNALMIAAHIVWGSTLGILTNRATEP